MHPRAGNSNSSRGRIKFIKVLHLKWVSTIRFDAGSIANHMHWYKSTFWNGTEYEIKLVGWDSWHWDMTLLWSLYFLDFGKWIYLQICLFTRLWQVHHYHYYCYWHYFPKSYNCISYCFIHVRMVKPSGMRPFGIWIIDILSPKSYA